MKKIILFLLLISFIISPINALESSNLINRSDCIHCFCLYNNDKNIDYIIINDDSATIICVLEYDQKIFLPLDNKYHIYATLEKEDLTVDYVEKKFNKYWFSLIIIIILLIIGIKLYKVII